MIKQTTASRIMQFMNLDQMNAVFIHLALDHFCKEVMAMDPKEHTRSLITPMLLQDIAQDWMTQRDK